MRRWFIRRWLILGLAWLAFLLSYVDRLAWANVTTIVGNELNLPVAALGVFVTSFYVGYVTSNFIGGIASDRLGSRLMLTLSMAGLGIATFAFSFTRSIAFGLAAQSFMGLFAGTDYATGVRLIASWFDRADRGKAMGIFMTATSLGVIVTNLIVPSILPALHWNGVYRALAAITLTGAVLCFLVIRDAPSEAPTQRFQVADCLDLFRNRDFVLVTLSGFGAMWGTWGFAFWASTLMIRARHLSTAEAASIVALFGVGAIISKPLIGLLSDWLGGVRRIPVIILLLSFVAILLVFGSLETRTQFRIVAPILGVAAFAYSPLLGALVTEIAGTHRAGSSAGVSNAFWQLGSVIVPLAVGVVFEATQSFNAAFITLAAGPLLGATGLMAIRER